VTPSDTTDARAYLSSLEAFGIKLGLASMQAICAALGHPETRWAAVHVGGTNGKGSVAAVVEEALRAAGHRTGLYTSPHLVRLEERVRLDGTPVDGDTLDEAILEVRAAVTRLQEAGTLDVHPTFFEVMTAAAFLVFRAAAVDVAVLEVGLGGRLDATNVVTPRAAALTSVALDHERHLGATLEAIAYEKAGIVKPARPLVIGPLAEGPRGIVAAAAAARAAPAVDAFAGCVLSTRRRDGLTVLDLTTPVRGYDGVTLSLRGDHQVANAVVAVRLLETLDAEGLHVSGDAVRRGLERARWPARLELLTWRDGRRVLLDGAHNPAGAAALAAYVTSEWPSGRPLVFGAMQDKPLVEMLGALRDVAHPLVLTEAPGGRAATADLLRDAAHAVGRMDAVVEPCVASALARAWTAGDPIVVAGSLYLAGRVLELAASA
jgi:dihydrofolate synthase / folylpolyglutamate synthase